MRPRGLTESISREISYGYKNRRHVPQVNQSRQKEVYSRARIVLTRIRPFCQSHKTPRNRMSTRLAITLAAFMVILSDAVGFVVAQGSRPVFAHFMV